MFAFSNKALQMTQLSSSHHRIRLRKPPAFLRLLFATPLLHSPPLYFPGNSVKNLSFSILPNRSIPTSFSELTHKPRPINVLKSVSFEARSSQVVAVVGPSGTGKSSLLKILSGRVKEKDFNVKTISINDQWMNIPDRLRKMCGFVTQEDNLLPLLTVRETFMFTVKLRLRELGSEERRERVEKLMQELFRPKTSFGQNLTLPKDVFADVLPGNDVFAKDVKPYFSK